MAKNRLSSLINIGGLALGLAACILILLFVRDELSYDDWIPEAERIFKIEILPGVKVEDETCSQNQEGEYKKKFH